LTQVRWAEDLAVSGEIDQPSDRTGTVRATLHMAGPGALTGDIKVQWPDGIAGSMAAIQGTIDGAVVLARTAAP
jgi:hypothetical protein